MCMDVCLRAENEELWGKVFAFFWFPIHIEKEMSKDKNSRVKKCDVTIIFSMIYLTSVQNLNEIWDIFILGPNWPKNDRCHTNSQKVMLPRNSAWFNWQVCNSNFWTKFYEIWYWKVFFGSFQYHWLI